jgi:hypothetical protein
MHIDDFVWLPPIVEKLAVKHSINRDEIEEVSLIRKPANMALILSARGMGQRERRLYESK